MRRTDHWGDGSLLPRDWRPDRAPSDEGGDHRWVLAGPDGRLRLGDGTEVALRPLRPGDGPLLTAGFERLSNRSRYRRFLTPMPRLSNSMLTFLTSTDGINHRAWGALVDEATGPIGAGVARWVRDRQDPTVADVAVTVIDDYQGRGLGSLLLDAAILDACAWGVERFEGVVLIENVASRRMLARGGATLRPDGGGVMAFTLPLPPRVEQLRSSPVPAVLAGGERVRGATRNHPENSYRLILKYGTDWSDHPDRGYPHLSGRTLQWPTTSSSRLARWP